MSTRPLVRQFTQESLDQAGRVGDRIRRTLSRAADGRARVGVVADARHANPLGVLEFELPANTPRRVSTEFEADGAGRITQVVTVQGQELGAISARRTPDAVTVAWRPGPLDRARIALQGLARRLAAHPANGPPPMLTEGVLYGRTVDGGATVYRVGGRGAAKLSIAGSEGSAVGHPAVGTVMPLGAPREADGQPQIFDTRLGAAADPPRSRWMGLSPAVAGRPAMLTPATEPAQSAPTLRVTEPGVGSATIYLDDGRARVLTADPVVGWNGTAEGAALLRDLPGVLAVRDLIARAGLSYPRALLLGQDATVVIDPDGGTHPRGRGGGREGADQRSRLLAAGYG
jgi:hypothetical protein